jgi:hypothetical protein
MLTLWKEGALRVQSRPHGTLEVFVERGEAGARRWVKIFDLSGPNVSLIVEPVGIDCAIGAAMTTDQGRCTE